MAVAAIAEVEPHMGATPACAKKQKISQAQQAVIVGQSGNRLAEPLLLVGIPRNPNALAGEGHLHQTGTIHVRLGGASPEVDIGTLLGGFAPGEHAGQTSFNFRGAQRRRSPGCASLSSPQNRLEFEPAAVAILQQLNSDPLGLPLQNAKTASTTGLGGQTRAVRSRITIHVSAQLPTGACLNQVRGQQGA